MGIFTFTDASVKSPKKNRWGDYSKKDVVGYGGYAKLICPDNTELETEHHSSYGMIGMYDIYELVAEWNRKDLVKLFSKKDPKNYFYKLKDVATLYGNGKSEEEVEGFMLENGYDMTLTIFEEWKRHIGIAISCDPKDMRRLKFPVKLTKDRSVHGYGNLYRSYETQ